MKFAHNRSFQPVTVASIRSWPLLMMQRHYRASGPADVPSQASPRAGVATVVGKGVYPAEKDHGRRTALIRTRIRYCS